MEANPDATETLKYNVLVSGTEKDDRSFLIEYQLPGSTSKTPQKKIIINNTDQCLTFSFPAITATGTSETSGHITATSRSSTSPGKSIIIDTLSIVVIMLYYYINVYLQIYKQYFNA